MNFNEARQKIQACADRLTVAAKSDPTLAERLVQEIDSIAETNPQPLFEAYSQRAKGHLSGIGGSMHEAVQHYRRALDLFAQSDEVVEKARTASTLVGALVPLGEFDEALSLACEARQAFQEANLPHRVARLDVNVGNLYHRLNRLNEALLHYERAAAVLEKSDDCEAVAGVLINRSVVLMLMYRFDEAMAGLIRARDFSEEHRLKIFATQSEYNRAYLLFLMGDFAQALQIMQIAESGFQQLGDQIHVAHCRLDRASILLELNLPEYALELADLAENGFRASGLSVDRARALLLVGRSLVWLQRFNEAQVQYSSARDLFERDGNLLWVSMAELRIASALFASGRLHEAAEVAGRARDLFETQNHVPFSTVAAVLVARIWIALREPVKALRVLEECEQNLKSQVPASIRYDIEYVKGRAFELDGQFDEACNSFQAAIDSLEFLLIHISMDHAMVRFLEDKHDVYERLAALMRDPQRAFELADRGRTRALTQFSRAKKGFHAASENARHLREKLRSDYLRFFQADQSRADALFNKIQQSERMLMRELIETEFRQPASSAERFGIAELNLSADHVLLEYFVSDNSVSVFVVTNQQINLIRLPISCDDLRQEVDLTRYGLLSTGDARREAALRVHLQRLYEALLAPVAHLLRRKIIVVPHRALKDFPFHILLGPDGYVAERYAVLYAPSAAAFALASRKETASSGVSLIFGADADLPAVGQEVRAVAQELPNCQIQLNETVSQIRTTLESATFIHVASHSLFRSEESSWSILNLGSDVLAPIDLIDVKINADLVTISACSTGRMDSRSNEAGGFVRAFSLWGVPSLVASLWEVNDEAASALMTGFYAGFRSSPDIAENLRQSMLRVKERFPHPAHWGAFVLIGKDRLGKSWDYFRHASKSGVLRTRNADV
jgi:CHAT domain-containing protein